MASDLAKKLATAIRSNGYLIIVQTHDEVLTTAEIKAALSGSGYNAKFVSAASDEALQAIEDVNITMQYLVLQDFLAIFGDNPIFVRKVREIALKGSYDQSGVIILVEKHYVKIPEALLGDAEIIKIDLPDIAEIKEEIKSYLSIASYTKTDEEIYQIAASVSGLPRNEIWRLLGQCKEITGSLDTAWLRKEKAKRVSERLGGALSFENTDIAEVGGLDLLRAWLRSRKNAFSNNRAKEYGLPEPKGLLLLGIPGSGKSLTAKTIARDWQLPLLRLDAGKLFGSLVGQSEAQTREAISAAEAASPCVLWIDEIEKALGGGGSSSTDGGTTQRVFGSLLTWLQEKTKPVFVVATANRIEALPPELLRKGRFDEIFFLGLPHSGDRREIFGIHLESRGWKFEKQELDKLIFLTDGYSGAEIEQVVIDAMFESYSQDRSLEPQDVEQAISKTVPLSKTMKDEISRITKWAEGRARPASSPITDLTASSVRRANQGIGI